LSANTQVVLITGASSGLGLVTAHYLAQQGYRVFGTSRHPTQAQADGVTLLPLDVRSAESIQTCLRMIIAQAGRLDVLINNAGFIGPGAASEELSIDQVKALFETNFFGVIQMTNAVLPYFRRQGGGRIINISSAAGQVSGPPFFSMYAASKHALEAYTEGLRYEVRRFNIHVSLIEPGYMKTAINQTIESPARSLEPYAATRQRVAEADRQCVELGRDPILVAERIAHVIHSPAPRLRYSVGLDSWFMIAAKRWLPFALFERGMSWLFLEGTGPVFSGWRRRFLDSQVADATWRRTWLIMGLGALLAIGVGIKGRPRT
jgi:NAD(P)-dependent dehydrogenase (short-subunit alcohol dehydrogenase family)